MRSEEDFARDLAGRLADAFRLAERDYDLTVARLATRTGIPLRTLQGYAADASTMPYPRFVRLLGELPDELASLLLEPAGKRATGLDRDRSNWVGVLSETCALDSEIADAVAHGMTPSTEARLKERTRRVIADMQSVVE